MNKDILTKQEFIEDIFTAIADRPTYIREGQAVFNYIDEKYGVARYVQFEKHIDCFYVDENIYNFINACYERYCEVIDNNHICPNCGNIICF